MTEERKKALYGLITFGSGVAIAVYWKQHRVIGFFLGTLIVGPGLATLATGYNPWSEWMKSRGAVQPAPREGGLP